MTLNDNRNNANNDDSRTGDVADKRHELIKLWRALDKDQSDIDFRRAKLAYDTLSVYKTPKAFADFCKNDLGLTQYRADELLELAKAHKAVPDKTKWKEFGGSRETRTLTKLNKGDQVRAQGEAKTSGRLLSKVAGELFDKGVKNGTYKPDVVVYSPKAATVVPAPIGNKKLNNDMRLLARVIADNSAVLPKLSAAVVTVVQMHVPGWKP